MYDTHNEFHCGYPLEWVLDNEATGHMTNDMSVLGNSIVFTSVDIMVVSNELFIYCSHWNTKVETQHNSFNLRNILHAPKLNSNLISVQQYCLDQNVYIEFHPIFFISRTISQGDYFKKRSFIGICSSSLVLSTNKIDIFKNIYFLVKNNAVNNNCFLQKYLFTSTPQC